MKATILLLLVLIAFTAFSQDYQIESAFESGKSYPFEVKRSKFTSANSEMEDVYLVTDVISTFSRKGPKLICSWKYGNTHVDAPQDLIRQIAPEYIEMFNIYRGFQLELLFDPIHGGIELENYEQMRKNIKTALLKIYSNAKTNISLSDLNAMEQYLESTFSTPELLMSSYFPEVLLYFQLYAQKFTDGKTIESKQFYPNPWGGKRILADSKFKVFEKNGNILNLQNEQEVNKEDLKRTFMKIRENINKVGNGTGEYKIPAFDLSIDSDYFYDLERKLITKIIHEKMIFIDGVEQIEYLEIQCVD